MNGQDRMQGWWLGSAIALALAVLPVAGMAQAAATPKDGAVPSNEDLASTNCAIGEERFLPGDYYYCLASQEYGKGHIANAQKFFTTAASWASKPAQYVLGVMALNGDHQPVNRPLALAWLALASERPNSNFRQAYDTARQSSTAQDRKAAEALLAGMRPTYADATAAVRAERRYADGMAMLTRVAEKGGWYCPAGFTDLAKPVVNPGECPPAQDMVKVVDIAAVNVFDGWIGHVQVGPLQQVAAPDAKSHPD